MTLFGLSGETALVTGAGSGIGQAIAIGIAHAGGDVACLDRPGSAGLRDTIAAIDAAGRRTILIEADVREKAAVEEAVALVVETFDALTLAVNAAGIANAAPAELMEESRWREMLDINLTGLFLCCQAEGRAMLSGGRGAIVNIASMSGSIVNRGLTQVHYNTSKAGVIHLTKSLAMEWATRGIRVNAISPGYTLTPMNLRPEVADQRKIFEETTPLGRMAEVDEIVGPTVFLLSGAASYVTGVDLLVDGGFACW